MSDSVWPHRRQPPGSPVPGILQERTLEWLAISFSMHESEKGKWSHSVVSDSSRPHGLQPTRLLHPWDFPGKVLEWGAIAFSDLSSRHSKKFFSLFYSLELIKHFLFQFLFYIGRQLICKAVLVSSVQQTDSIIHISILFSHSFPI